MTAGKRHGMKCSACGKTWRGMRNKRVPGTTGKKHSGTASYRMERLTICCGRIIIAGTPHPIHHH